MRISPKEMLIMMSFLTMIRYRPKSLCKVVVFLTTVSLALLFAINAYLFMPIASFNFYITSNNVTQTNGVAYHVKKQANSTACSEGMFLSPNGCLSCPNGTFSFPGWSECKPFLNCSEIATQVHNTRRIPGGFTKLISLAEWKGREVVHLKCLRPGVTERCLRGMTMLEKLQGPFVTRLIGKCCENLEASYTFLYLALINRAGDLYGRILTEVVNTDRTQCEVCTDDRGTI